MGGACGGCWAAGAHETSPSYLVFNLNHILHGFLTPHDACTPASPLASAIAPASRHSPGSAASAPLYSPSRSSDVPPGCRTLPVFSGSAAMEANTAAAPGALRALSNAAL